MRMSGSSATSVSTATGAEVAGRIARGAACGIAVAALLTACGIEDMLPRAGEPSPWSVLESSGRELLIGVYTGCNSEVIGVDVNDSAEAVEILAYTALRDPSVDGCWGIWATHNVVVTLDDPLGDRALTGCRLDQRPDQVRDDCADIADG